MVFHGVLVFHCEPDDYFLVYFLCMFSQYSLECNGGPSPINGWKAQKPHSSLGK